MLGACAPARDWRELRLPGTELMAQLPCRPARFERQVVVAGAPLRLYMLSCEAAGVTYGVASADVGDPARVDPVLDALLHGAEAAIRADVPATRPETLAGTTPFRGNLAARLHGVRPDGRAVEESVRVFGRGTRVFQLSAIGRSLPDAAVRPFEDGVRFDLIRPVPDPN